MKEGPYEQLPSSLRDSNRSNSYILNAQSRQTKRILKYLKHFRAFLVHRNLPKKKSYIGAHQCNHCYNHKSSKYDKSNMFKSLQKTNRVTYSFIRCPKNPKNVKNITKINLPNFSASRSVLHVTRGIQQGFHNSFLISFEQMFPVYNPSGVFRDYKISTLASNVLKHCRDLVSSMWIIRYIQTKYEMGMHHYGNCWKRS